MKNTKFTQKKLAASISMLLGASALSPAIAQEADGADDNVEVIQVSGIRGSLARSQDIKRESSGVVDAISAEEMGKFPDTNLAESLQRITGVTISRSNNEGNQITVRGFGPDFNLLTLNGRQMPGTGNNRSFDLQNLASTGVETLQVYKSSRVDIPSGGLGATVDILTSKPLSSPGTNYSFSAKGIYDESNEVGDDVTPELAALYSQTFFDDTVGISISASYQERDFQRQEAEVPGWQANTGAFNNATNFVDPRPQVEAGSAEDLADGVEDGRVGNSFVPRQLAYRVEDIQRNRTNTHLTLQWAPNDDMTFTADYLFNEAEQANEGYGYGIWFNFGGNVSSYELDENGTAIRYTETGADFAHNRASQTSIVEQDSIGFNFEWQLSDDFHLEFDFHDSAVETDNGMDPGTRGLSNVILGPNNIVSKTYDYTTGDAIPQFSMVWPNGATEANPADFEPLFAQFSRGFGRSEVEQFQLHLKWENPNDSFLTNVKGGLSLTTQSAGGEFVQLANQGFQQYTGRTQIFPESMFTRVDQSGILDELADGLQTNYRYDFNLSEALSRFGAFFPGFQGDPFNAPLSLKEINSEGTVEEETEAAYLTAAMYFDIGDMPLDVNLGVRYESTDVTSTAIEGTPIELRWFGGAEWRTVFDNDLRTPVTGLGDYDLFLPAIDLRLEVAEDMYTRASWGKTISRAPLGNMAANRSLTPRPVPGSRTGSFGNPGLEPFESTNFDISFEWYYEESSYVSVGYFRKSVINFISLNTEDAQFTFDGLRDPVGGPRAAQAEADLIAAGTPITVESLYAQLVANGHGVAIGPDTAIVQSADDPLVVWDISQPTNDPDAKVADGIEFAVQHMFGDTGYGTSINFTIVDSDSEFEIGLLERQAPLIGVSDSANVQLFYEDDQLSVKLTYAWRDDFLAGVGQAGGSGEAPPQFVKAAGIVDFSVNYDYDENLTVFFEGYNIGNETEERYGRYEAQFLEAAQFGPRFALGARYTFE